MLKKEYRPIYKFCLSCAETDAIKMLNQIMDMRAVPMHGPVHHFIVPAVLLTCHNNAAGANKEVLKLQLKAAAKRARIVPAGNCANSGTCGAALGFGQFISILNQNDPDKDENWGKVMAATSAVSAEIAKHGGPRCCKRDSYITLTTGAKELERLFGIPLKADMPMCKYFPKNPQCRKQNCPFYPKPKKAAEFQKAAE